MVIDGHLLSLGFDFEFNFWNLFGAWDLEFGICLEFGIWNLEFGISPIFRLPPN